MAGVLASRRRTFATSSSASSPSSTAPRAWRPAVVRMSSGRRPTARSCSGWTRPSRSCRSRSGGCPSAQLTARRRPRPSSARLSGCGSCSKSIMWAAASAPTPAVSRETRRLGRRPWRRSTATRRTLGPPPPRPPRRRRPSRRNLASCGRGCWKWSPSWRLIPARRAWRTPAAEGSGPPTPLAPAAPPVVWTREQSSGWRRTSGA
mmetsp:Transcript_54415/g.158080  ORF Transcript_54415/g.158080 Transcript_54415/m.158080 type:complete len:205 (-) Transcript_54415:1453-2067(-)